MKKVSVAFICELFFEHFINAFAFVLVLGLTCSFTNPKDEGHKVDAISGATTHKEYKKDNKRTQNATKKDSIVLTKKKDLKKQPSKKK